MKLKLKNWKTEKLLKNLLKNWVDGKGGWVGVYLILFALLSVSEEISTLIKRFRIKIRSPSHQNYLKKSLKISKLKNTFCRKIFTKDTKKCLLGFIFINEQFSGIHTINICLKMKLAKIYFCKPKTRKTAKFYPTENTHKVHELKYK